MVVTCLDCIHRVSQKLAKDECHLIPPIGELGWAKVSPTDAACNSWEGIGVEVAPPVVTSPKVAIPKKKR
jgi:hypothetical protein